jgi:hypothetical protein
MSILDQNKIEQLKAKLEATYRLNDRMSGLGFKYFLERTVIDCTATEDPEPKMFVDVAEPWQLYQSLTLAPAIEAVTKIGTKPYRGPRFFWRGMPRGHDKTSSIARMCNWILAYSKRNLSGICTAADRDQAALLTDFMQREAALNPWYNKHLDFKRDRVVGRNGTTLRVLAADAYGAYGLRNDFTICDELTHWTVEELWHAIATGIHKRPGAVLVVLTNAGVKGSWQWDVRNQAANSKSWMTSEQALDGQRGLPNAVVRRLHKNQWIDPAEESGYVTRADALQCEDLGRELGLKENEEGDPSFEYVAAIDYGPRKDRTVCVIGHRVNDRFEVDKMDVWQGRDFPITKTVPIKVVEDWIETVRHNFPKVTFIIDPYQMESTIQKYSGTCRVEKFDARGGKGNMEMAILLRDLIVNKRLAWYPDCGRIMAPAKLGGQELTWSTLPDEFADLVLKFMNYGFRFDNVNNKHDDRVVALGMAAWRAMGGPRRKPFMMKEAYF